MPCRYLEPKLMTTIQLILLIVIVFCAGIEVGIISNFNRNRFLIKHDISPKKLGDAIENDQIPLTYSSDINISIEENEKK